VIDKKIVQFLKHFKSASLREALGRNSLSAIEKFIYDGYSDLLFRNHKLQETDAILVLGGYLGDSVESWLNTGASRVYVVEPVTEYFDFLEQRFAGDSRVVLFKVAVGDSNGTININIDGLKSGVRISEGISQRSTLISISEFVSKLATFPKILEINIEGGEYPVMMNLISENMLSGIATFVIQFHRYSYEDEVLRSQIRSTLSVTHEEKFCYDWVWERWDIKNGGSKQ
jgi:FkbM family methyltransferase